MSFCNYSPHALRSLADGYYLVRTSKDTGDYALSLVVDMKVHHYRIQRFSNGSVALIDAVNGNGEFPTLEELLVFYKTFDPNLKGGLATYLKECIPPQ